MELTRHTIGSLLTRQQIAGRLYLRCCAAPPLTLPLPSLDVMTRGPLMLLPTTNLVLFSASNALSATTAIANTTAAAASPRSMCSLASTRPSTSTSTSTSAPTSASASASAFLSLSLSLSTAPFSSAPLVRLGLVSLLRDLLAPPHIRTELRKALGALPLELEEVLHPAAAQDLEPVEREQQDDGVA